MCLPAIGSHCYHPFFLCRNLGDNALETFPSVIFNMTKLTSMYEIPFYLIYSHSPHEQETHSFLFSITIATSRATVSAASW